MTALPARPSRGVEVYLETRNLRMTQRLLGHSSPVVTTVDANLLDDDVRRGVEQIWAASELEPAGTP